MAKIYEVQVDHEADGSIKIAPPRRGGRWAWGLLLAVFLISGAAIGLAASAGAFSNAIEVAQNGLAASETGDTATN